MNGNGVTTELTFDPNTQWLAHQVSVSPNRDTKNQGSAFTEIQDLSYTYDSVGNPLTYRNDVPGPVPNLFSGSDEGDLHLRPVRARRRAQGEWQQATDKLRKYDLKLTYDTRGNVTSKTQKDWIQNGKKELVQTDTTYSFTRTYNRPAPHQATGVTNSPYSYDADGNLTGILDAKGKFIRAITWDAADRMRTVTDGPATTDYNYDDSGQRAIERGPAGETATVNPWVTVRNTTEIYKHVWAGNDRIGTQRDDGGIQEIKQYFLHKDLQGSTNIVTDITGNTFQHHEYFATGEVWVDEKSTVFRTPYQFGGGYVDEVRKIINFGARWYDQNREMFYSPDPVLDRRPDGHRRHAGAPHGLRLRRIEPAHLRRPRWRPVHPGPGQGVHQGQLQRGQGDRGKGPGAARQSGEEPEDAAAEVVRTPRPQHRVGRTASEAVQDDRRHRQALCRDQHLHRRGEAQPRSLQAVHREEGIDGQRCDATSRQQPAERHQWERWADGECRGRLRLGESGRQCHRPGGRSRQGRVGAGKEGAE